MTSKEIRESFIEFFKKRNHAVLPSASLVTSDNASVINPTLFNTAGMQPLVPYLLGEPHPLGKRLVNIQKCLRTVDIADVGDATHATFFEMMGNWSLGDYFKKEAINWSYEFLTGDSKAPLGDRGLGLDPNRLYITVFAGDDNAPRDEEAANIWKEIFQKNKIAIGENTTNGSKSTGKAGRIFYLPAKNNWWEAGDNGPCGPDTEMYYDVSGALGGKLLTHEEFLVADENRDVIEVWNDVFMQYEKKDGKIVGSLPKPSVDTGAGLERLSMTLQNAKSIYDTDLFSSLMSIAKNIAKDTRSQRILSDHIRATIMLISDGVIPSNTDRGYILRRLLRRAVMNTKIRNLGEKDVDELVGAVVEIYGNIYTHLVGNYQHIKKTILDEVQKFDMALNSGVKEFEVLAKKGSISGFDAFKLFSTFGLPIDLLVDIAKELQVDIDTKGFETEFTKHQELSRSGAEQKFKGGLADANDPMVIRYHTATHLLHQALHDVLGPHIGQKGSNITGERLRFDFSHTGKMTDEEKKKVENIVNEKIEAKLPVNQIILQREEADKIGARSFFGEKYGDQVSVYFVGQSNNPPTVADARNAYSKEFCGGPHVKNTGELAGPEGKYRFKIQKEEAVAQGVRRIKAVLH